jgi:hypothetical protein
MSDPCCDVAEELCEWRKKLAYYRLIDGFNRRNIAVVMSTHASSPGCNDGSLVAHLNTAQP